MSGEAKDAVQTTIKPEHKQYLDTIRDIYTQSGATLTQTPEMWGVNASYGKTNDGSIQLVLDAGCPHRLNTPDGEYIVAGGHWQGDATKFMDGLKKAYEIEPVSSTIRHGDKWEVVRLKPKTATGTI